MIKLIVAAGLCIAASFGQISTASAQQYFGPTGNYYSFGTGAIARADVAPVDTGWLYTRNQPAGYGRPYPSLRMADGTLACANSNYRPMHDGWCHRIW
jgi:hypothetical protein